MRFLFALLSALISFPALAQYEAPKHTAVKLDDVVGCLKWEGPPKSLAEMDAAVLREAKRRACERAISLRTNPNDC